LFHALLYVTDNLGMLKWNDGLFVPEHFRSRERKVHRDNFHSVELSFPGSFRSSRSTVPSNVPKTWPLL